MNLLHIETVSVPQPFHLTLTFSDGDCRTVDVRPLLKGPVFQPLLSPDYFQTVEIDPVCRTVVWPCGADFAPEALRALPPVPNPVMS
jgi:hypothetical protein